jgi:hypothetical protein
MSDVIIKRRVRRIPYARNGNVGMNKPLYVWDIVNNDGSLLIPGIPTLREAKIWASRRGAYRIVR